MGSLQLSLYTIHQSLFQVGIGSLSSNRIVSTSLLTGVGVCRRGEGRIKHLCLFPTDLRIQEAGFHWQCGFESQTRSFWISLTRNELQIFPHVKQMNNRVVLINQSSFKPSTDGSNELPFHEDFSKWEENTSHRRAHFFKWHQARFKEFRWNATKNKHSKNKMQTTIS